MAGWTAVPVKGTFENAEGMRSGKWSAILVQNVLNSDADVVLTAGEWASGKLNVTPGSPSLEFDAPALDDPANFPNGFELVLQVSFDNGGLRYRLHPSVDLLPDGIDLSTVVVPQDLPELSPLLVMGVPNGLATLGADGLIPADQLPESVGGVGYSAYDLAVRNGFEGTLADWLISLVGDQGPQGPQGPQGAVGPKGDAGNTGSVGPQGAQGTTGGTGPQGPQGLKGDVGDTGPAGPQGLQGITGGSGLQGPKGDKGDVGDTGPAGPQGSQGTTGGTGPQGPQGIKGDKGDVGNTGSQGIQGLKGDKGDTGTTGATGPQGPVGPEGPSGASGSSPRPFSAQSDQWQNPVNLQTQTTGTPNQGTVYLMPSDIGPVAAVVKGLGSNVSVAAVLAAATIVVTYGIYKDNGSGGAPDFTQLLGSVTVDPTSTGIKLGLFGSPLTLQPGRYWVASLYVVTGSPTTAPSFTSISIANTSLALPAATAVGTVNKAWFISSQTSLPTTNPQTLGVYVNTAAPIVALRYN